MTKIVIQEEPTGCGIACVAMIAGKSYGEVKQLANTQGIFAEDEALYTSTTYVRKLLSDYDIEVSEIEHAFDSWENMPEKALLATKYRIEEGCPRWHWSIYVANPPSILDPAAYLDTNIRTDFSDIQVEWFIPCV